MATPTTKDKTLESKLKQMEQLLNKACSIMDSITSRDIQGTQYENCDFHGAENDMMDAAGAITSFIRYKR